MMKKTFLSVLSALAIVGAVSFTSTSVEASGGVAIPQQKWSWTGPFGTFDRAALRRGLQVYTEVCSGCHSLNLMSYRNLADIGFSEDEIKAIAIEYEYEDTFDDDGELISRPGTPADYFPAPFANEKAARSANGGSLPPDFSTLIKAREHLSFFPWATVYGEDYVVALMTGYHDEAPEGFELTEGLYYNDYFTDYAIAMAPPLFDDFVEYADGTPATVEQMSYDVANFMAWASDPTMQERKEMGLRVILFMIVLSILLYFTNKRVWRKIKKGQDIDPSQL